MREAATDRTEAPLASATSETVGKSVGALVGVCVSPSARGLREGSGVGVTVGAAVTPGGSGERVAGGMDMEISTAWDMDSSIPRKRSYVSSETTRSVFWCNDLWTSWERLRWGSAPEAEAIRARTAKA